MVDYKEQVKGARKPRITFAVSEQNKELVNYIKKQIDMDTAFEQVLTEDIVPQILNAEGIRETTKDKIKEIMRVE